ncbi:MAG: hypothetical protein QXF12_00825 [Candidatus Aenigmatarchaeota archaeon]
MKTTLKQGTVTLNRNQVLNVMNEVSENFRKSVKFEFARPLYYLKNGKIDVYVHKHNIVMLAKEDTFLAIKKVFDIEERYERVGEDTVYVLEVPSLRYKDNYVLNNEDNEYNEYGLSYVRTKAIQKVLYLLGIHAWWITEDDTNKTFYNLMKKKVSVYDALQECYTRGEKGFAARYLYYLKHVSMN